MFKVGMEVEWWCSLIYVIVDVIYECGYSDIIMVQIVKCVGVFGGLVYYYFGLKDQFFVVIMWYLFVELVWEICESLVKVLILWECILVIIVGNFVVDQFQFVVIVVWFVFYVQFCIIVVNSWFLKVYVVWLVLNLIYNFKVFMFCNEVWCVVEGIVFMIDGVWIWQVLNGVYID